MPRTTSDAGGAGRKLLIFVGVLVVVLVVLDRIGDLVAERLAADTIQKHEHLTNRPSVDITGFPFLTQLATGNFGEIVLTDDEVPLGSTPLRLSTIQITLHTVHVARNLSSVHARTADAVATMSYRDLGHALGARVRYEGGGRISAAKSIRVAGRRYTGVISARPRFVNDTLSFGSIRLEHVNRLLGQAAALVQKVFSVRLPLGGMPFEVRVRSLRADPAGLELHLVGRNLRYSR